MSLATIQQLLNQGESETLEFKRSTGQLGPAGQTLCAFLNAEGGTVVIGVTGDGTLVGQDVSDKTRVEIALMLDRFEPPATVVVDYVDLSDSGRKLIVLEARPQDETRPFTFDGRPYQRTQSTTSVMPQARYEAMLLERAHARRRWENQPAVDVTLADLDHEEILLTRATAITQRRISAGASADVGDILDRLGLRRDGVVTQAAQVLYGRRFLPDSSITSKSIFTPLPCSGKPSPGLTGFYRFQRGFHPARYFVKIDNRYPLKPYVKCC